MTEGQLAELKKYIQDVFNMPADAADKHAAAFAKRIKEDKQFTAGIDVTDWRQAYVLWEAFAQKLQEHGNQSREVAEAYREHIAKGNGEKLTTWSAVLNDLAAWAKAREHGPQHHHPQQHLAAQQHPTPQHHIQQHPAAQHHIQQHPAAQQHIEQHPAAQQHAAPHHHIQQHPPQAPPQQQHIPQHQPEHQQHIPQPQLSPLKAALAQHLEKRGQPAHIAAQTAHSFMDNHLGAIVGTSDLYHHLSLGQLWDLHNHAANTSYHKTRYPSMGAKDAHKALAGQLTQHLKSTHNIPHNEAEKIGAVDAYHALFDHTHPVNTGKYSGFIEAYADKARPLL